eukprot:7771401-Lingulodinium_polyedra.AAC.1
MSRPHRSKAEPCLRSPPSLVEVVEASARGQVEVEVLALSWGPQGLVLPGMPGRGGGTEGGQDSSELVRLTAEEEL